ncbi:MAG: hypothetical protein ACOC44_18315 [Promethearchaeia archaeon]
MKAEWEIEEREFKTLTGQDHILKYFEERGVIQSKLKISKRYNQFHKYWFNIYNAKNGQIITKVRARSYKQVRKKISQFQGKERERVYPKITERFKKRLKSDFKDRTEMYYLNYDKLAFYIEAIGKNQPQISLSTPMKTEYDELEPYLEDIIKILILKDYICRFKYGEIQFRKIK